MRRFHTRLECILIHIDCFHLIALLIILAMLIASNVMCIGESLKPSQKTPDLEPGSNFAKGSIDLGGLIVAQSSAFKRVWKTRKGGPNDQGATFYEPSTLPDGFFILGHHSHDNNKKLDGRVLVVKDDASGLVAKPVNFTLLWSSKNSDIKQTGVGYVWQPIPRKGFRALGHIVTRTHKMPSSNNVRCVRSDFVKECSDEKLIWGEGENGVNLFEATSESIVGIRAMHNVPVGTFNVALSGKSNTTLLYCLKNNNVVISSMPNSDQVADLMTKYAPMVFFHPDEKYFPSTVSWFFNNGALLYQRGNETNPVTIDPMQSNLPQGGSNDGAFWLDLPADAIASEHLMKGNWKFARSYLHVKPMQGGTITDLAIWLFYPYNGPARMKFLSFNFDLGRIGSHVGDWEHVTLRINNLDGKLQSIFFAEHSGGQWVSASELEYTKNNKPIVYASLNGHGMFPHEGLVLQGKGTAIGMRNDMAKSQFSMDLGAHFEAVSAEYLGFIEPPWLNYCRHWGPTLDYNVKDKVLKFGKVLIFNKLKRKFRDFVNGLPNELFGQEGPLGPKMKASWNGDE